MGRNQYLIDDPRSASAFLGIARLGHPYRQYWTGRVSNRVFGRTTQQQMTQSFPAMRSHYDEINLLVQDRLNNFGRNLSLTGLRGKITEVLKFP
jgi:hypothetical protein